MNRFLKGTQLITSERARTRFDESKHADCSVIQAAQCYAEAARRQVLGGDAEEVAAVQLYWPWTGASFGVDADPIRNLVKAGALIAAEIDRLRRIAAKKGAS